MLSRFVAGELPLALFWLVLGLIAGLAYGFEMVGLDGSMSLLSPERARSLHISQMLYGFFPLILSLLPFALFEKEGVLTTKAIAQLRRYFVVWNLFLLFMSVAIVFGNVRGLPFYDFPYQLTFLLAFGGVFYLLALVDALGRYERRPVWVNVSLAVVVVAPPLLVFLMNPQYGQVEHSLVGPHGDNTLGMSFALIPLYYLLIRLSASGPFVPRWHALWIVPLMGYLVSLAVRNFIHPLSYGEEWFFQYLSLLYLPLLWIWLRDAEVGFATNPYLVLSIAAFAFVDVEGNILFIPQIRELIHRNDLVVGHAHIAMGLGVAFMALSILHRLLPERLCAGLECLDRPYGAGFEHRRGDRSGSGIRSGRGVFVAARTDRVGHRRSYGHDRGQSDRPTDPDPFAGVSSGRRARRRARWDRPSSGRRMAVWPDGMAV